MQRLNKSKKKLKKIIKRITILYLFVLNGTLFCQQIPHYTQYLYNMQIINPAYVGVRSDLSFSALSRQQWVGIDGAPTTRTLSVNARTVLGLGVGLTFVNDKIGLSEINNINFDGSYTIETSRYERLSVGIKLDASFFSNNLANGITPDGDIYESNSNSFFNAGFGALYYGEKFYLGISAPYILESPQFYIQPDNRGIKFSKNLDVFLSGGILLNFIENFEIKPSTMIRYSKDLPLSFDLNTNFIYKETLEAGVSYRYKNSLSFLFSIFINKRFRFGYAYDYTLNDIIGNLNTHEFILNIDINLQRNTRWLRSNRCYF